MFSNTTADAIGWNSWLNLETAIPDITGPRKGLHVEKIAQCAPKHIASAVLSLNGN
jgi:hypothetical protein